MKDLVVWTNTMAGFLNLSPISICELEILTPLFRVPRGPQGCQKIHKNILEINLMSFCPQHSAKVEIKLKNLKNCKKMTVFLVYSLIRAEPGFHINTTTAHNLFGQ